MAQRGRKSAAGLSIIASVTMQRPAPPDDLTEKERELWLAITNSKSVDYFDAGTEVLLTEYCRLKTTIEVMAVQINLFDPEWLASDDGVKRYRALTNIRDQAQGRLGTLARSLRLTNQSRFQPTSAAVRSSPGKANNRLWERS